MKDGRPIDADAVIESAIDIMVQTGFLPSAMSSWQKEQPIAEVAIPTIRLLLRNDKLN